MLSSSLFSFQLPWLSESKVPSSQKSLIQPGGQRIAHAEEDVGGIAVGAGHVGAAAPRWNAFAAEQSFELGLGGEEFGPFAAEQAVFEFQPLIITG